MSERALGLFLQRLLESRMQPVAPVQDAALLHRLVGQPAVALAQLVSAHVDALLSELPAGFTLRPATIPATTLWVAAALNNLVWSVQHPGKRLLTVTLRLAQALPPATDLSAVLAYHSLLGHLDDLTGDLTVAPNWQAIVTLLLERSLLTAAWLPRISQPFDWPQLLALLQHPPLQVALRDRLLRLPHTPDINREVSRLLAGLLAYGGPAMHPLVLTVYEADCRLQRSGSREQPTWTILEQITSMRGSNDPLERRNAERLLLRYRPLAALLDQPALLRPYTHLDARFLTRLADLLPTGAAQLQLHPAIT